MQILRSLRVGGVLVVFSAFALGLLASGFWFYSTALWAAYLDNAKYVGAITYDRLQFGTAPPDGIEIKPLPDTEQATAETGFFEALSDIPKPSLVTNLSILPRSNADTNFKPLTLAIISPDLQYPLASLSSGPDLSPAETMGALTRLLATYCSTPIIIAKVGDTPWVRIEGPLIWECASAPTDYRLLAGILGFFCLGVLATVVLSSSAQFTEFAQTLRVRHRLGGPDSYEAIGIEELQDIVSAVNNYLAFDRQKLAERVAVLSGVTHDLGTPATRLKLRAALIPDIELRAKLESDIDSMTGIIESVLTYTRAELDAETPRQISLTSLIESLVADYQDIGSPVEFLGTEKISVQTGPSLFMTRRGTGSMPDDSKVVLLARPIALSRAVSNLIDNAVKYGRCAKVGLKRYADEIEITVEDEGASLSSQEIDELRAPFKRGANASMVGGHGLGLTIVSTVANLHGGRLEFTPGPKGLIAKITILRQ